MTEHLWGLEAIGQAVGTTSRKGTMSLFVRRKLPMFKRVRRVAGKRPQIVWYSTSGLIQKWMLLLARDEWERQAGAKGGNS